MSGPVRAILVGAGGYGGHYLQAFLDEPRGAALRLVGAVDPRPAGCKRLDDLARRGIPLHADLDAAFAAHGDAELAVIASPIALHADQTCAALARGLHVLVEKPLVGDPADVVRMLRARDAARRHVGVGYQWSFSAPVLALKRDLLAGRYGGLRHAACLALWPRTLGYFGRNGWAGRLRDGGGRLVRDSIVNNAMAHFLHNLLFLAGDAPDRSADPVDLEGGCWRANAIETCDTAALRVRTASGAALLFLGSHAIAEEHPPSFRIECDAGRVTFPEGRSIVGVTAAGERVDYGDPDAHPHDKLWAMAEAVRGGAAPVCGIESATPQVACIERMHRLLPEIPAFPAEIVREIAHGSGDRLRVVEGLADAMRACYAAGRLPGELGVGWAASASRGR